MKEEEAKARAAAISNVKYHLRLSIVGGILNLQQCFWPKSGSSTYEAHLTTHFDFKANGQVNSRFCFNWQGVFLDFIGKTIHKLEINGVNANKGIHEISIFLNWMRHLQLKPTSLWSRALEKWNQCSPFSLYEWI